MSAAEDALYTQLCEGLLAVATPAQKAPAEAYFKGAVPFLGVKGPDVDAVFKASRPARSALEPGTRLALALRLLEQEPAELRHLGVLLLHADRKLLPPGWLQPIEGLIDRRCTNWGTADAFAGRVLRYRLPDDADRGRITAWSSAESPWRRRMACVAFVNEAHKGLYGAEIGVVVRGALQLDHRFSQLGAGWLLRNRWLAAPAEVEAFLWAERGRMRREALRYAIEKMPVALQQTYLTKLRD
jgi:3-methyladenine DNA glycosylase AlkD